MSSSIFCLTYGAMRLCVDASFGAHIVEYSINEKNALATGGSAFGSTFWPSPQDSWGWPPLATLDNKPYTVKQTENELLLTSEVCTITGLQVKKRFWFEAGHLKVNYSMLNTSDGAVKYAPWEISRIRGGITFYQSTQRPLAISTGAVVEMDKHVWHEYKPQLQKQNEKIFGNGSSGWLANANDGLLLVKRFEQVPEVDTAPGEAEVEIYAHGDPKNAYIEMEQQGAYRTIEAKQSYQWSVEWHLKMLPKSVIVRIGNPELSKAVVKLLSDSSQ